MIHFKFEHRVVAPFGAGTLALASFSGINEVKADQGGVSFWIPGFYGSLAATPLQPGWSLTDIYYHTTVSAGAGVSLAREFQIGKIPVNLSANLSANVNATGGSWPCHSELCVRNAGPGWPVVRECNRSIWDGEHFLGGDANGRIDTPGGSIPFIAIRQYQRLGWGFGDWSRFFTTLEQWRS